MKGIKDELARACGAIVEGTTRQDVLDGVVACAALLALMSIAGL